MYVSSLHGLSAGIEVGGGLDLPTDGQGGDAGFTPITVPSVSGEASTTTCSTPWDMLVHPIDCNPVSVGGRVVTGVATGTPINLSPTPTVPGASQCNSLADMLLNPVACAKEYAAWQAQQPTTCSGPLDMLLHPIDCAATAILVAGGILLAILVIPKLVSKK